MGTSLADQLKRLAVPQTSLLIQDKRKPSLLFDPKEAANLDRETFYDLGLSGLNELKSLHHRFSEFESSLFNQSSISLERSVETKESNAKLDRHIRKFLLLLSPYFLLKPSHKALEWLINRFHIHEYNVDELMMLILPYHETRIFVRVLQLVDIKSSTSRWHWLYPLQKPGVILAKSVLLKRCSKDVALLKFICQMTILAVKEYKSEATVLSTLFAFYCTSLIGALEGSKSVTELQLTHLIKSLLRGLQSPIDEYSAAALMVTAQITRKTQLSKELLFNIINRIIKCVGQQLAMERVTLLVLIYQNQDEVRSLLPDCAEIELSQRPWFSKAVGDLDRGGVDVTPLLSAVLSKILNTIQVDKTHREQLQTFTHSLLSNVALNNTNAKLIIQCVVKAFDHPPKGTLRNWCSELISLLERQHSTAFDHVVKESMVTGCAMNPILPSHLQLVNQLNHSNYKMRINALNQIQRTYSKLDKSEKEKFVESFKARVNDDSPKVVLSLLKFDTEILIEFFGEDDLSEQLIMLLGKFWKCSSNHHWLIAVNSALEHLRFSNKSSMTLLDTRIFIALFPFLIPSKHIGLNLSTKILNQHGNGNRFLKTLKTRMEDVDVADKVAVSEALFKVLKESDLLPLPELIKEAIAMMSKEDQTLVFVWVTNTLLAFSLRNNTSPQTSIQLLDIAYQNIKGCKMVKLEDNTLLDCMEKALSGVLPIQCVLQLIMEFVKKTVVPLKILRESPWWNLSDSGDETQSSLFILKVFNILLEGSSAGLKKLQVLYEESTEAFYRHYCPTVSSQVVFLCKTSVESDDEACVQCLRKATALLQCSDGPANWALSLAQRTIVPSLLIAVSHPSSAVRTSALDVLRCLSAPRTVLRDRPGADSTYVHLVEQLVERREELITDAEQIHLALYTSLSSDPAVQALLSSTQQPHMSKILDALVDCVLAPETPGAVCAGLLAALHLVVCPRMLLRLEPLGLRVLAAGRTAGRLDVHRSATLAAILSRMQGPGLEWDRCWELFETALGDHHTALEQEEGKPSRPALLALDQVTRETFLAADEATRRRLLAVLSTAGTDTDRPAVVSATARAVKRLPLDARLVVGLLEEMRDAQDPDPPGGKGRKLRRFVNVAPSVALLQTPEWRRGTTLLELLQNKKKLQSVHVLLPCLFDLLRKCLQFEEQAPVEYTKQLLLSCLLHCCQKLSEEGPIASTIMLNAELVVECVRATQNPQTHHHALLLLSHIAQLRPSSVLHSVMALFTFMGSSVLRQDDAYSFQIIAQIIETIIPTLVHSAENWSDVSNAVCGVLRVFVDALLDIPEHRRLPLFNRLLTTLGPQRSLWILLSLVIESQVVQGGAEGGNKVSQRLEFAQNIAYKFAPEVVFISCVHILEYIQSLPADKETTQGVPRKISTNTVKPVPGGVTSLFDVERHSAKQLRHLKYALTTFLVSLLAAPSFVSQVSSLTDEQMTLLEPHFRHMVENLLTYIGDVSLEVDASLGKPTAKYWRVMLNQGYEMLDKVNILLPSELFLGVVCGLMKHPLVPVQRKALELLNARLQHQASIFSSCDRDSLFSVMPPLTSIIETIDKHSESFDKREGGPSEEELIQQTALLSIKLLARLLGAEEPARFKVILNLVTKLAGSGLQSGPVLASVLLCLAELCGTLRAHAIPSLSHLVPPLLAALKAHTGSADIMILSTVTAICKIVEVLPHFLSPYLKKLLFHISILSAKWQDGGDNPRVAPIVLKLKAIRQKISATIAPRVLIPTVGQCFSKLLKQKEYTAIGPLLAVLSESFPSLAGPELVRLQPDIMSVLLHALDIRHEIADANLELVAEVEGHAVGSLVALVLKLSESAFRPLYCNLFHWATEASASPDRAITFYRLSSTIAESLKGLFVLFAGYFLKNAASLLEKTNVTKTDSTIFPDDTRDISEQKALLLLQYVLETLHCVFLYDSGNFVNKERFDILMQPIVDQLENTLGGEELLVIRVKKLVTPCIAQMAAASGDDILWKQLNYQVLLKTRHTNPQVRLAGLASLCAVAGKLGEDFLPLLPETIPFLAELMEDEEEAVEKAAQTALQDLESVLGEPLQKYF